MATPVERVIECIREVFVGKGLVAPALTPETRLDDSLGLDSMDYAELVVRLEAEFGFDPFADGSPRRDIRTVADLASNYTDHGNA